MLRTRMFSLSPGTPGPQAADAAGEEVDPHPGLAGPVERLDHARVGERVELGDDAPLAAERHLVLDEVDELRAHVARGDEQRWKSWPGCSR